MLATLVGVAGGLGIGYLRQPQPAAGGTATPLPAASPSVPVDPPPTVAPYAQDIPYPAMPTTFTFGRLLMGNSQQAWQVPVPKGWQAFTVSSSEPERVVPPGERSGYDELRFRPKGEPALGGYSLRVKTVNEHVSPSTMVGDKVTGMHEAYDEVEVSGRSENAVRFVFRDSENRRRYNYFQWFGTPGTSEASLEMSVVGRQVDQPGLDALFAAFANTVRPA